MEDTMTDRYPHHDATREDVRIQATWARKLAMVYVAALLLLVAFVAGSRMLAEPQGSPDLASAPAPHVAGGAVTGSTRRAE
jgi:hypothetical protein